GQLYRAAAVVGEKAGLTGINDRLTREDEKSDEQDSAGSDDTETDNSPHLRSPFTASDTVPPVGSAHT
ncbi:hypothetical protein, partial [Sphingomonas sp. Leaf30]|uniref:hypothetical protein n=1 Tax=Sphingomonas sp. Leaf30 TaxID=1736213 RepID=UPI001F377D31